MTEEEKSCSRLLLEIIGVFNIVAAYVNDETIPKDLEAQKALDQIQKESDYYNIDEDEVMDADQPEKMRSTSSVNRQIDEVILIKAKISLYHEINSPTFCKSITPEFAKKIIEKFNYEKFVKRTLKTLNEILSTRTLSQMDKDIINQNMKVTQNLFLYDERSLSILYNFKDEESKTDLKGFIVKGMTFSTDQEIKSIFMNTLWFICQKIMHTEKERLPLMVILEILKEHFFSNIKDSVRYYGYEEFYNGFCNLLREYFKVRKTPNQKFENIIDPRIFLRQLVQVLKDYQTREKRNTILEDHNLIGMFDIMSCILSEMPELVEPFALEFGLLDELWKNCLFQETVEAPKVDYTTQVEQNNAELHTNKCNTKTSRARAFSLLTLLTTNSEKVRESVYKDCLYKMVSCLERPENFATKSESEARLYSYAGLKNQGATCYMNSMVQQLYMIPAFKYLFLAADDGKDENYDTNNIDDEKSLYHNKKIDDNLLHQFQNTLAHLELTERQYYNALGLCFAMKDYSGMPTNCSMQQDSQEFLNLCFDRLESLLKPTPQQYIIQDIFGAKQCTHMTCDSCDYVKSRIEDYYILSVPVKGFKSLEESFNSYTDGEIISDFTCDN